MGSVIKSNRYRLIDNRSFELPLPMKYELLKEDDPVALYEISEDEKVTFSILTKYKENMITPIYRRLDIADVYYFFSSRVFQNGTPFTAFELQLIGLEKYNVYDIIRKTRGVTPYDTYWLRFDGDKCDYETARSTWEELTSHVHLTEPEREPISKPAAGTPLTGPFSAPPGTVAFTATSDKTLDSEEESQVSDILSQHRLNYADRLAEEAAEIKSMPVENNTMSMDEIDALLLKSGLGAEIGMPDEKPAPAEEAPEPSGGKMSQEDIEKMLAAASAPAPEAAPAPAEEAPKPSGGKMSQEDIEKMLAAASAPAPEPAPTEEASKSSGGKMSQEDIEKMLATASAVAPVSELSPAPAEETPKSSGGKMSQDDIEALLNGMKEDAGQ